MAAHRQGLTADEVQALRTQLAAQGVHTLLVQFTDLHGTAKGKHVPLAHLGDVLATGAGFAGPSIRGTGLPRTGPRSEYHAVGDPATLQPLPWAPGYARIVGDGVVGGEPFDGCPRQVLRRQLARLAERGWTLRVGIEPEFFLLRRDGDRLRPVDDADRLDKPSYDLKSLPRQAAFLRELHAALEGCGLDVTQLDHEDAQGQYEVNFAHDEALRSADHLMLFKLAGHAIAERHGALFSMMPKPFADQPGSGLHFHVSLWRTGSAVDDAGDGDGCVFTPRRDDPAGPLSPLGGAFIAGVLAHAPALAAIAAPTVNSYKRLVIDGSRSGTTWAPAYVAHGPNNRTALVRTLRGRFEWRLPDASANPYLAIAALVAAGLDGIDRGLDPGPPAEDDLYTRPLHVLRERGIGVLPQSLAEAVDALVADPVVLGALGPTLAHEYVQAKRDEWLAYARHVSPWEVQQYADAF